MRTDRPAEVHADVASVVDLIIERVGPDIRVGMPLGLGKPVQLCNALYARVKQDPTLRLTILTALSLERPEPSSDLEARFLGPFLDRILGDAPALDYLVDVHDDTVPANIVIREFFYRPGGFMGNRLAQRNHVSSNYTHAARDVFDAGCNVAMQMMASRGDGADRMLSMSCNPDTSPELIRMLEAAGREHVVIAQINNRLPYMVHDAEIPATSVDVILEHADLETQLFSTPAAPVGPIDHAIGMHASALIRDGGTLQVGIGALGDAVVHAMIRRHQQNASWRVVLDELGTTRSSPDAIAAFGGLEPFAEGLYGSTEMFVEGFLHLKTAGILTRKVYDLWAVQQLINEGRLDPSAVTPEVLDDLEALGVRVIRTKDFVRLQHHGLFRDDCSYDLGHVIAPDGTRIMANLGDPQAREALKACVGTVLRNGVVLHGGFFLGSNRFYEKLRQMSEVERAEIFMTGVDKVNQLDLNPRLHIAQRTEARFVNTGLLVSLSGAVTSDGLENHQIISGVGGQYDFVAMAHQLHTGRSILLIRATRESDGEVRSNVVFSYGHVTIPRHLRDIVITEYGIAELRGKTDEEIIIALLEITDSRFQDELLEQAKDVGKISADHEIAPKHLQNYPERITAVIGRHADAHPAFPFGTELTEQEQVLGRALRSLAERVEEHDHKVATLLDAARSGRPEKSAKPYLERMGLDRPRSVQDRVAARLLANELELLGVL